MEILDAILSSLDPGYVAMLMLLSQFVGRIIPDDKTGVLGFFRRMFKTLGVYMTNRQSDYD